MRVWLLSLVIVSVFTAGLTSLTSQSAGQVRANLEVPRIWEDTALADWATPVVGLNVRPTHYSSAEYYRIPPDNLKTYPVYHPDSEPPGYWEELQRKKPEPLVDMSKIKTKEDWIAAGELAFREMDSFWSRTTDPADIAQARDPRNFDGRLKLPDGSVWGPRWVVTSTGVTLSWLACANCHRQDHPDGSITAGGPRGPRSPGVLPINPSVPGAQGSPVVLQRFFVSDSLAMAVWRMFSVPWAPDDRIEKIRDSQLDLGTLNAGDPGIFNRPHGSPFYATKIMDLQNLHYSRYLDATGTHRLRGPEDVARYAAFISGADPMEFGAHRLLSDEQRRMRFRYSDEVLNAIGVYLMSLEPPKNPNTAPRATIDRGEQVFQKEGCANCHAPPNYTSGKLTLAEGFEFPASHPNRNDVVQVSVGTDPGLALRTRKGTGFYKVPSLRGIWYRPRLLHDGSIASLEEMFNPARLTPDHVPGGWKGPGVTKRAIPGHRFGLALNPDDREALLAFLRSL
jgi:hypothetical protein